ncbi:IS66 family insertion sequence element accessory protein TnpB [Stutzerimonas stutzeri]|nr:IS66 family insertion sequence element accessory protein TnpB [Stutzerimonas stutzeri]MDI9750186.1 IS66 family insertion sequence element accessory protein TnpB [Stutzerimonas stutzeri]
MKVLVHDGFGIWLAARRLNKGRFVWSGNGQGQPLELNPEQLQALVVGLPWQRLGPDAEIRLL